MLANGADCKKHGCRLIVILLVREYIRDLQRSAYLRSLPNIQHIQECSRSANLLLALQLGSGEQPKDYSLLEEHLPLQRNNIHVDGHSVLPCHGYFFACTTRARRVHALNYFCMLHYVARGCRPGVKEEGTAAPPILN